LLGNLYETKSLHPHRNNE